MFSYFLGDAEHVNVAEPVADFGSCPLLIRVEHADKSENALPYYLAVTAERKLTDVEVGRLFGKLSKEKFGQFYSYD